MKRILLISLLLLAVIFTVSADRRRLLGARNVASAAGATATDTFNRADSDPLSTTMSDGVSTWTSGPGSMVNCAIISNQLGASTTPAGVSVNFPTFSANHIATATLGADTQSFGVMVRVASSSDADGYMAYLTSATAITVYRVDDTGSIAFVALGANVTVSALATGDTFGLGISGTTLTVYTNGVSTAQTRTDATYSTGQPGAYIGSSARAFNSWTASDL